MTSPQEQTREILERLNLRLGPPYETLEDIAWSMKPEKAAAYWKEMLSDAQMAEQISNFTAEERKSWEDHLAQLRKEAVEALRAASNFSCMLWEQLSEGEEFELNPESYWRSIISHAQARKQHLRDMMVSASAATEGVDAPPPLPEPARPMSLRETLEMLLAEGRASKQSDWAGRACDVLCLVLSATSEARQEVRDSALALVAAAKDDPAFAHSSLSIAEEVAHAFC